MSSEAVEPWTSDWFGVLEVVALTGVTYRQLDYWDRADIFRPSIRPANGSGSGRVYSFDDVLLLCVMKKLLDEGIVLLFAQKLVSQLRDNPKRPRTAYFGVEPGEVEVDITIRLGVIEDRLREKA